MTIVPLACRGLGDRGALRPLTEAQCRQSGKILNVALPGRGALAAHRCGECRRRAREGVMTGNDRLVPQDRSSMLPHGSLEDDD